MEKNLIQRSLKDSLFTGIIALALFGPIVGLRTVAKNEALVIQPKWLVVFLIVIFCAVGRFFINLYTFKKEQRRGEPSSFGKAIANFLDEKGEIGRASCRERV